MPRTRRFDPKLSNRSTPREDAAEDHGCRAEWGELQSHGHAGDRSKITGIVYNTERGPGMIAAKADASAPHSEELQFAELQRLFAKLML